VVGEGHTLRTLMAEVRARHDPKSPNAKPVTPAVQPLSNSLGPINENSFPGHCGSKTHAERLRGSSASALAYMGRTYAWAVEKDTAALTRRVLVETIFAMILDIRSTRM
jgi:hypothetical protein